MQVQTEKRPPMNQQPFTAFINLISLDQEIRTAHDTISKLNEATDLLLAQKAEHVDRFDQFKRHTLDLKKKVHEQELNIKSLDDQEKKKKEMLDNLQSNKGYQLLKKEIDSLKQAQYEAETDLMSIWNKLEVAQKELNERQESYDKKLEDLHKLIAANQEEILQLQASLKTKQKHRPGKEAGIPNEWLEKYTHMRMRVEDPVVAVMNVSCGACYYTITEQELIRLKRKALVQCKGCFRLLYMKEAMQEETTPKETIKSNKG